MEIPKIQFLEVPTPTFAPKPFFQVQGLGFEGHGF